MPDEKDPTEPIRLKASQYANVDKGTACTQSSFKTGKKAFLFIGMQGGRYKAMFKLEKSKPEAIKLAAKDPDRFQAGSNPWVTARFTADNPMPKKLWTKWLDESYELTQGSKPAKKKPTTKAKTKTKKKPAKATKKKSTKKPLGKQAKKKKPTKKN